MTEDDTFQELKKISFNELMRLKPSETDLFPESPESPVVYRGLRFFEPLYFVNWLTNHGWKLTDYIRCCVEFDEDNGISESEAEWVRFKELCDKKGINWQ